jgi:choline kinase
MKAIILSAGKGSRLLPLTENTPKCLLPLAQGYTLLTWQLSQLEAAGVQEAVIVSGFNTAMVEAEAARFEGKMKLRVLYNPFYHVADNLGSVWMTRGEMNDGPFMILNGDTIFTSAVARALIAGAKAPITLTVSSKDSYDEDDMKVIQDQGRLQRVSKKLDANAANAESIGFMMFQKSGAGAFKARVEELMRSREGTSMFYLSVIDALASEIEIGTVPVAQDQWQEVDFPDDYKAAQEAQLSWLSGAVAVAGKISQAG